MGAPSAPGDLGVLIHVYKTAVGGSAQFIGVGNYGISRPDIGTLYGDRFKDSGYSFTADLTPGHTR